jgi:hypothetical protein
MNLQKNKMQISSVPVRLFLRGPNSRARRDVLRTVVDGAPASIVRVQESKLDCVPQELMLSLPMDQIWRERNARVFRGASESVQHLLVPIREKLSPGRMPEQQS